MRNVVVDYLNTRGAMGNRWKHFGIREDNQTLDTRGRVRYLKREGQLVFQNKTGYDETRHRSKQNVSRVRDSLFLIFWQQIVSEAKLLHLYKRLS